MRVEDIHAMCDKLRAHGVSFKGEPVSIRAGRNRGGPAYFNDIPLELLQPPVRAAGVR